MRFIPPPNGSSYFEVSAIFGIVILMTLVATLQIYGIASRNFINTFMGSPTILVFFLPNVIAIFRR